MNNSSREIIKMLKSDGWYHVRTKGAHFQFKHRIKKGTVTVPHPKKDLSENVVQSILKQAGLK